MHHSEIGAIAHRCWSEIPLHFPFVRLGEFVVMPNHTHGILIVDKSADLHGIKHVPISDVAHGTVDPQDLADLPCEPPKSFRHPNNARRSSNRFGPQSRNLASIIRGFKIGVTKYARHHDPIFEWQSLYHDIIIRDDRAFNIISCYIRNNPRKWAQDRFKKRRKR